MFVRLQVEDNLADLPEKACVLCIERACEDLGKLERAAAGYLWQDREPNAVTGGRLVVQAAQAEPDGVDPDNYYGSPCGILLTATVPTADNCRTIFHWYSHCKEGFTEFTADIE